jgi:hypothetical protein
MMQMLRGAILRDLETIKQSFAPTFNQGPINEHFMKELRQKVLNTVRRKEQERSGGKAS